MRPRLPLNIIGQSATEDRVPQKIGSPLYIIGYNITLVLSLPASPHAREQESQHQFHSWNDVVAALVTTARLEVTLPLA
jgi:hypothetical protein